MKVADMESAQNVAFDFEDGSGPIYDAKVKVDVAYNPYGDEGYADHVIDIDLFPSGALNNDVPGTFGDSDNNTGWLPAPVLDDKLAPKPVATRRMLMLEPYGDCLPKRLRKRLFPSHKGYRTCGAIDLKTNVFYVASRSKTKGKDETWLIFTRVGVLYKDNTGDPMMGDKSKTKLPKDIAERMKGCKRPYHYEIDWWHVERYLDGEEGWGHLRKGLVAVVWVGSTRYCARYEDADERPRMP